MKLFLLFLPLFSFSQVSVNYSHQRAASGVTVSYRMENDHWFASMGAGVILPKKEPAFIPVTVSLGRYLSNGTVRPFLLVSTFTGMNLRREYGAYAEAGAGLRVGPVQTSATYRAGAMNGLARDGEPLDLQGWWLSIGVNF